jgi:hypothetical protein
MRRLSLIEVLLLVIVAILVIVFVVRCSGNEYVAASQRYDADSLAYIEAGNKIDAARAAGRVTDAQWTRFETATQNVRAADAVVHGELARWRDSGKKPVGWDDDAANLRQMQREVIALAQEVAP